MFLTLTDSSTVGGAESNSLAVGAENTTSPVTKTSHYIAVPSLLIKSGEKDDPSTLAGGGDAEKKNQEVQENKS